MVYCTACACEVDVEVDDANGFSCCVQCGRVLEDTAFSADVTFAKDAGGESTVVGQFVSETGVARGIGRIHGGRVYAYQADSHEKAQQRGRQEIAHLVDMLSVRPREESIEGAHRLYKIALQRGFTRGRRTAQVAGACLYLICRQDAKPFLLIDFSDALQVNVFTLGAVFLQLAKLLRVADHPTFAKPVDPSLYIHRFADRLDFGRSMHSVANTALRLVASMKRDWIQTGRRPSGICGAALYIAAHIHGFERSIRDVVGVVHIGEHTLSKRLYEFSSTSASAYTADEFDARAREIEAQESAALEAAQPAEAPVGLLEGGGCEHLRMGEAHFAHAMCRACYLEFMQSSGGVYNGANPPAYERNRRREVAQLLALPQPEGEGSEGDEYDQEEQGIAEAMVTAFHDSNLQQFSRFLPSSAEAAAAQEGGDARQQRGAAPDLAAETDAEEARGGRNGGRAEEQQAQQEAGGKEQHGEEEQLEQPAKRRRGGKAQPDSAAPAAAAPAGPGVGPSQLSEQTADAPPPPAGAGAADEAAAPPAGTHSQRSDQTAAAGAGRRAADGSEDEGDEEEAAVGPAAIVPVPQPAAVSGGVGGGEGEEGGGGEDTLSDIDDADVDMYLADDAEVKCKEEIWNMMNRDWLEKQAQKRAAQQAAERAVAEQAAAQEAAEAAGVAYKRGRGRPVGSKTKNHRASALADMPPAETAQEAAMRMLDHRKLSKKINYSALADLFADGGGGEGAGEPPALAAEVLEAEEDRGGRGQAVTAAMRQRRQEQEREEARREARQQAALEAERRRVGGLGLPIAGGKLGGGGGLLGARGGLGTGMRRPGGLGSLRDAPLRSQATASAAGGSAKKSVRFAD